jgi:hypothetical protein
MGLSIFADSIPAICWRRTPTPQCIAIGRRRYRSAEDDSAGGDGSPCMPGPLS